MQLSKTALSIVTVAMMCLAACGGGGDDDTTNPGDPAGPGTGSSNPPASTDTSVAGLQAIYLHQEYQTGVGGYLYVVYQPYLMFSNGDVYRNLATSVDRLDVNASKASEPGEWGTWKKDGDSIAVAWSDGDSETWPQDEWYTAQPAKAGEQIAGDYSSISGGGNTAFGGDVITFSSSSISFDGNRFTYESAGGGSTRDVSAYASQDKAGTYALDGYTITLHFNNGTSERKFFYFYPDSKDVFGIGDDYYTSDD